MKIGFYWLAGVIVLTIGVASAQQMKDWNSNGAKELNQRLEFITDLLRQDLSTAKNSLKIIQAQYSQTSSLNQIESVGSLQLLGLAIREKAQVKDYTGYIPLLHHLPLQLNEATWLCLPECQLVLTLEKGPQEILAVVNLKKRLAYWAQFFGVELAISDRSALSTVSPAEGISVNQYIEKEGHHQLTSASQPLLEGGSLFLSAQLSAADLSLVEQRGNLWLWLVTLFVQALVILVILRKQKQSRYFHQALSDAADHILQGQSDRVHQLLGFASGVTSHSGQPLLRRFAMLGLREEAARVNLSKVQLEQKWLEQHDKLTGLSNRQYIRQQLNQILNQETQLVFLLINIDDFKEINDASGQQVGNEMLLKVARLLKRQLQESDLIGRMSGDEFAISIRQIEIAEGEVLAQRILEASQHIMLSGRSVLHRLSLSIGIVTAPKHGKDFDTIMTRADVALSYAKGQGKGRYASLKDPKLEGHLLKQRFLYSRVHSAIRDRRLALATQPIVDMKSGSLTHSEILLRIKDEKGQYVSAYPLIQAAERSRDVGVLDKWVLNQVLNYLMQCRREGRNQRLAVNISGVSISDPQLTEAILQRIEFSDCGDNLIIEITESAALENIERIHKDIERLQQLGCKVALDDFGIGYSSVNNLLNLPFDYVKVDGCFVRKLTQDPAIGPLLEFLVSISSLRHFQLIAEFVETSEAAGQLQLLGVQLAQGYYYGEPMLLLVGAKGNPTLFPYDAPVTNRISSSL